MQLARKSGPPTIHTDSLTEAARAISATATQIDLALREAQAPIARLVATVSRMGLTLASLSAAAEADQRQDAALDLSVDMQVDWALGQLQRDFNCAVEDLQFHDRMVQHFTHLRDYLSGVSSLLAGVVEMDREDAWALPSHLPREAWRSLRDRLFQRLISDAQRQFLQLVLPADEPEARISNGDIKSRHAAPGSIEIF